MGNAQQFPPSGNRGESAVDALGQISIGIFAQEPVFFGRPIPPATADAGQSQNRDAAGLNCRKGASGQGRDFGIGQLAHQSEFIFRPATAGRATMNPVEFAPMGHCFFGRPSCRASAESVSVEEDNSWSSASVHGSRCRCTRDGDLTALNWQASLASAMSINGLGHIAQHPNRATVFAAVGSTCPTIGAACRCQCRMVFQHRQILVAGNDRIAFPLTQSRLNEFVVLGVATHFFLKRIGVTHKADVRRVSNQSAVSVVKCCCCFTRSKIASYSARISSVITGVIMPHNHALRHQCDS